MALIFADRVKETSTTAGTGTLTLNGAAFGFQSFTAIGNGNTTYYAIYDNSSGGWEVGIGTYTASGTTLSRDTILSSSNAGAAVAFSSASKEVFVTYPSERSVYKDSANVYTVPSVFNAVTANSIALTTGTITTTPSVANDLVNKSYVDTVAAQGIVYHDPVYVESPSTDGNLNALYNQPGGPGVGVGATLTNNGTKAALVIDGVLMTTTKRVLIYNQTNGFENGIYTVTTVGTPDPGGTNWVLTRATDADTYAVNSPSALGQGDAFFVTAGNTGAGELYSCNTVGTIIFGTTNITFAQISATVPYMAGTGLNLSPSTTFNISNTGVTAATYGAAATVPVLVVNAQGQITSATDTAIAIPAAQVSGLATSATTDTTDAANITTGTLPSGRLVGGYGNVTAVGTLVGGTWNADVITPAYGGTGLTSLTANNVILGNGTSAPLFVSPATSGNVLTANGTTWISAPAGGGGGGGGGLTYVFKSANYTAVNNEGVLCDTSVGAFTVTLPATPAVGAQVVVADAGGVWGTNNLTVDRNGSLIAGLAENLVCDISGVSVQLVFDGTSWEVYAQIGVNSGTLVTLNDIQTLTNKDLTSATNTFPTSLATLVGAQTLTNKTIAFANNTLTGVQAALVSGSNIRTVNGNSLVGSGDLAVGLAYTPFTVISTTYTVVASDLGKIIYSTGNSFTISLPSAGGIGFGFNVSIWNMSPTSTDAVTIDAFGLETIDGVGMLSLRRGEGMQIVSDGNNWQTGNKKVMRAYAENMLSNSARPVASGNGSLAISAGGNTSTASNTGSINIGGGTTSGQYSIGIFGSAAGGYSSAIGLNSGGGTPYTSNLGAMALSGSYASGQDSFAAASSSASPSYGAVGAGAIAMGYLARAASSSTAIGGRASASSTSGSISISTNFAGQGNVSSGANSITLGEGNAASAISSVAWGYGANARINGKQVWAGGSFANTNAEGSSQTGVIVLRWATTTATPAAMTSDNGSASTTNQVILPNDSTFIFRGQLVARNTGSDTDSKVWEFKGGIRKGTSSSTTTLIGTPSIDLIASDGSAWDIALTADTTNGGLRVTVTGEAAKTIRWVATVWTTEVTG